MNAAIWQVVWSPFLQNVEKIALGSHPKICHMAVVISCLKSIINNKGMSLLPRGTQGNLNYWTQSSDMHPWILASNSFPVLQ